MNKMPDICEIVTKDKLILVLCTDSNLEKKWFKKYKLILQISDLLFLDLKKFKFYFYTRKEAIKLFDAICYALKAI